jgi:hypothetical protein
MATAYQAMRAGEIRSFQRDLKGRRDSVAGLGGAPFGRTAPPRYGLTASSEMLFTPNFSVAPKALSETKA